jgi:phosphatidylglycerophosphate synthase
MAPNLITLIAFLMLVVVNIIFMLPDENNVIPAWKLVMMGVSILLYQNLDNMDGKQARRTSTIEFIQTQALP